MMGPRLVTGVQCSAREPADRPSAWSVLLRLQRHVGEEVTRGHISKISLVLASPLRLTPHRLHRSRGPAATRGVRSR